MNAAERFERWENQDWETPENDDVQNTEFALRGDRALMLKDEDGWFAMVTLEDGTIVAEDPDGTQHDVYCEPVWLSWASDHFYNMYSIRFGGEQ